MLQGLSAGVELGGVSIYLAEIATPGNRGFYCAWQSASQQVAVVFTALVGLTLTGMFTASQMADWGWRIPLGIGCLIIPVILWLRRSLEETAAFKNSRHRPQTATEVFGILFRNWRPVLVGMMLMVLTTTFFYLITAYTPTFGRTALALSGTSTFLVTLCVGASDLLVLPIAGAVSDRIGRHPLLLTVPLITLLSAYPVMAWLVVEPSAGKLLATGLWFSVLFGCYTGALIPLLTEIMPPEVRTAGFALAYSLATALFGGFTPAICTYLIQHTGSKSAPAFWLMLAACIGMTGAVLSRSSRRPEYADAATPSSTATPNAKRS